jgi:antitoxin (DNA-binding transcriptional repressor) of toxin-antitoxin stability system
MTKKKQVSIHEAKTHLSKLIKEALLGVDIVIANGKKPLVKLVVIEEDASELPFQLLGKFDNQITIPEDFDEALKDLKEYM